MGAKHANPGADDPRWQAACALPARLIILPDAEARAGSHVVPASALPAVPALEATLAEMGARYSPAAIRFAILAMEYDLAKER
jgi:hypothetical protein